MSNRMLNDIIMRLLIRMSHSQLRSDADQDRLVRVTGNAERCRHDHLLWARHCYPVNNDWAVAIYCNQLWNPIVCIGGDDAPSC